MPHTPGEGPTCTEPQLCEVCGVVLAQAKGHSFREEIRPASCTEGGFTTFRCPDCGLTYRSDYTRELGHNYQPEVFAPNCTEGGFTVWTCENCGDSYTGDYVEPLGHEWDEGTPVISTSCNGEGMIDHRCLRCDYHYLEAVSAEGHSPGPEATCTEAQICEVCGAVLRQPAGHSMKSEAHPATCTEMGYTEFACEFCGYGYKSDYTLPVGHDYVSVTTEATCTESGRITVTCSRCGDSYEDGGIEPLGHEWDEGTHVIKPTCNSEGMIDHRCVRCDYHYLEAVEPLGHVAGAEATCVDPHCTVCGAVLELARGHDIQVEVIAPTCSNGGYTSYRCQNCDLAYERSYTKELGHNYVGFVTVPDCYTPGYTTYVCANCGESYISDHVEALGHEWNEGILVISASCNGEGMIDHRCVRCDYHYLEAVSAEGHTPGTEATCTEPQLCTVCGAVLALPLGHSYASEVTAPTCTAMGFTAYTCSRCGDSYRSAYVEATGHRVSDWIVDREPTQDAEGSRHKECVVCHTLLETETLDKLAVSAITDTRGEAVVGAYLVIVTDTESGTPVMGAAVLLSGDRRIQVKLPDGRLVDYGKQTTVGVYMNSDRTPVPGITVTLTDGYDNISIGITDKNGTVTLPAANGTTNPEGRITIGYVDGRGNRGTITVRLIDFESGRPIPGAVLTVKNGKLLVMLPEGTDLDEADRITVIVYDNRKQPVANLEVTVTNDLGTSETGFTGEDGTLTLPGTVQTERHTAYVNGYPDGSFGPEYGMTRAEATAIFARILAAKNGDTISDGAVKFTDVPDGAWYRGYVAYLTRHGIVNGTSETEFSPDREIIRAEFVALAVRFFEVYDGGNVEVINEYIPFNDVSANYWAAEYIHDAAVFGWIKGYEDGSFRAGNRITRAEVVTIVNRVLGHAADRTYVNENGGRLTTFNDVVRNHWAFYDIMEAANTHNAVLGKTETWSK